MARTMWLQTDSGKNGGQFILDVDTREVPILIVGNTHTFHVGAFHFDASYDLSSFTRVNLILRESQISDADPIIGVDVDIAEVTTYITMTSWNLKAAKNVTFEVAGEDLDYELGNNREVFLWMVITAFDDDSGDETLLGSSLVVLREDNNSGVGVSPYLRKDGADLGTGWQTFKGLGVSGATLATYEAGVLTGDSSFLAIPTGAPIRTLNVNPRDSSADFLFLTPVTNNVIYGDGNIDLGPTVGEGGQVPLHAGAVQMFVWNATTAKWVAQGSLGRFDTLDWQFYSDLESWVATDRFWWRHLPDHFVATSIHISAYNTSGVANPPELRIHYNAAGSVTYALSTATAGTPVGSYHKEALATPIILNPSYPIELEVVDDGDASGSTAAVGGHITISGYWRDE